jgi:peroxiredoxin
MRVQIKNQIPKIKKIGLLLLGIWFLIFDFCFAQGMLPAKSADKPAPPTSPYLLIGNSLPESLTAIDANGQSRTLLSHKTPIEVLVLGFYSTKCEANQTHWRALKQIYESYKDWHVSFLGISVQSDENVSDLAEQMKKAGLPYAVVRDEGGKAARALNVTALPEIIIVDEWSQLRYRGSVEKAGKALENVIAHQEAVDNPEPGVEGCALQ